MPQASRTIAPLSNGARSTRRRDYRLQELVEDVNALIDASGAQRVHLVGYDWGATFAWAASDEIRERLASLTTMSTPHPAASPKALATSRQFFASWYIPFFQLPGIPEWYFGRHYWRGMSYMAMWAKQPPEAAVRDARAMAESDKALRTFDQYGGGSADATHCSLWRQRDQAMPRTSVAPQLLKSSQS